MEDGLTLSLERTESLGGGMKLPDEVAAMLRLRDLGWGSRRIAAELGCGRETVRRWVEEGAWRGYRRRGRRKRLAGLEDWLAAKFRQHRGNADDLPRFPWSGYATLSARRSASSGVW